MKHPFTAELEKAKSKNEKYKEKMSKLKKVWVNTFIQVKIFELDAGPWQQFFIQLRLRLKTLQKKPNQKKNEKHVGKNFIKN